MIERTLVFVKPKNEVISENIFDYLDTLLGLESRSFKRQGINHIKTIPQEIISEHYRELEQVNKEIFSATMEAYKTGTIFLSSYSGEEVISRVRFCIGHTDPLRADFWTVRGKFRRDSLESALAEKRYLNNTVHASSNRTEAERELKLWKDYLLD
jgi:nucleoside diphosphate kinase